MFVKPNDDGALQIMYGIDGRRDLAESARDDLSGYAGARPVRIGNGAFDQRQNDVFGAVLGSILLHTRRSQRLPRRLWPIVQSQAECAARVWREPDQGIWEARGAPRHYVSSKLMSWVALDRAARLAEIRGAPDLTKKWQAIANEIRADILDHGLTEKGSPASALRDRCAGRLDPAGGDRRLPSRQRRAVAQLGAGHCRQSQRTGIRPALSHRGNRRRSVRQGGHVPDLLVLARLSTHVIGEVQRARDLMERLLRIASPLGLYAEEFDVTATGHHLGNFPQAFTHLALIEAASQIVIRSGWRNSRKPPHRDRCRELELHGDRGPNLARVGPE